MTITEFSDIIETFTPSGFEYYATGSQTNYNMEKSINDTMLLVLPNPYPSWYRGECYNDMDLEIWFGHLIDIKKTASGTEQHNPYSSLEVRDYMHSLANTMLDSLKDHDSIQVLEANNYEFYDSPDGKSVNRQVWLKIPITAKIYKQ